MLARTWHGVTEAKDADRYLEVLRETGFSEYRATQGNLGVLGLRRVRDGQAEFLLLTLWESEEAIRSFAGEDMKRAVYYPEDDRFLLEKEEFVEHYEVVFDDGRQP